MTGRPRTYAFSDLSIGDRMAVALNGRDPVAVQQSVINAAAYYQRTRDAGFLFTTDAVSQRGFVLLERIAEGARVLRLIDADRARMARLDRVSRERPLTTNEIDRLKRTALRLQRRAA